MKTDDLVLITGNRGFFGQTRKPWVSMNSDLIRQTLTEEGFHVKVLNYHQAVNQRERISNAIVFYSFNQKANRRAYLRDLIRFLDDGTNVLIPSYDLLLCHEDKGFQELYKKKIGLKGLAAFYFSSIEEVEHYPVSYPVVFKPVEGSTGKNVFLVKNRKDLERALRKVAPKNFLEELDLIRRKYFRKNKVYPLYPAYSNRKDYEQYRYYIRNEANFILQEFIPGLTFDYRVLILFDRYYPIMRHTRENDFRASGARKFNTDFTVDFGLLDYAREIHHTIKTPFLSLDIVHDGERYHLLEFQALHFGISSFYLSKGYYSYPKNGWQFVEENERKSIERQMARSLSQYIRAEN